MASLVPVDYDPFSQAAPAQEQPSTTGPQLTPVDYDPFAKAPQERGVASTFGSAFGRGLAEAGGELSSTAKAATSGTLEGTLPQPAPDPELESLLTKGVSEGYSDPKWWAAQLGHGFAHGAPTLGGAVAGGALGTAINPGIGTVAGMAGGGALGSVAQTLVPAYQRARSEGLSHDEAFDRAWKTTGVQAGIAGLMGAAPGVSIFGRTAEEALKRPVSEAVAQMFGVQPAIATAGTKIQGIVENRDVTPDELGTSFAVGMAMGAPFVATHAAFAPRGGPRTSGPVASPETVGKVFKESVQQPTPEPGAEDVSPAIKVPPNWRGKEEVPSVQPPLEEPKTTSTLINEAKMPHPSQDEAMTALAQEFKDGTFTGSSEGANMENILPLLSTKIYGDLTDLPKIVTKELLQNSADAVEGKMREVPGHQGKIEVSTDPDKRLITIRDNGTGMLPSTLGKEFIEIAGSLKETLRNKGGFGIAKLITLYANHDVEVMTLRDGVLSTMMTSGEGLKGHLVNPSKIPPIQIKNVKNMTFDEKLAAKRMFPDGSGTIVKIKLLDEFPDASTGGMKKIPFPRYSYEFPALHKSPLFSDIEVVHNRKTVRVGKHFPREEYAPLIKPTFDWGNADVYVSLNEKDDGESNIHILSNGIWQFDMSLKKNPNDMFGDNVPRDFYIDTHPKVKPTSPGYPFDLNRQRFTQQVGDDFSKIFNYISTLYNQLDFGKQVESFGNIHYLSEGEKGAVKSEPQIVVPDIPLRETPLSAIRHGDNVEVRDGRLIVNGKELPELTKEEMAKTSLNFDELTISQDKIDPNRVMIHDNVYVTPRDSNRQVSLHNWAEKKYGQRFHNFLHEVGDVFLKLRDMVASVDDTYLPILREAIGISFDEKYRGVSIRIPFRGSFLNIARPEYIQALRAAFGYYGTMIHELAHFKVRNHAAEFPAEMQKLIINIEADLYEKLGNTTKPLLDRLIQTTEEHKDILGGIHDILESGHPEAIGQRFKNPNDWQARDGNVDPNLGGIGGGRESAQATSGGPEAGKKASGTEQGPSGLSGEAARVENKLLSDEEWQHLNAAAMKKAGSPEFPATPATPSTVHGRRLLKTLGLVEDGSSWAAAADRFNKFYEWMLTLVQVADRNLHLRPLQLYREAWQRLSLERAEIMNEALDTLKQWRKLGGPQGDALAAMIDDYMNRRYLSKKEVEDGVIRRPNEAEFRKLVSDHKLGDQAVKVFQRVVQDFDKMLGRYHDLLKEDAMKNTDLTSRTARLKAIDEEIALMAKAPYMPAMRFGDFTLTKRGPTGAVDWYEIFRTQKERARAEKRMRAQLKDGERLDAGFMKKEARPFVGLPKGMLEQMAEKLQLSADQRTSLDELRAQYGSSQSFRPVFRYRTPTPGYSTDFMRAYANYFFHGSNYLTKLKYVDSLRDQVKAVRDSGKFLKDHTKRDQIGNFMDNHLAFHLDPKGDWAALRGLMFHWALGFSPAAATLNLSQMIIGSYPFLASKFGDVKAIKAMGKSGTDFSTYYKKATIAGMKERDFMALNEAVKEGIISEAMASELAALSEGRNLMARFGGNVVTRAWSDFLSKSSWMFETTEKMNRRITFRAAWQLASDHPDAKYVREMIDKHSLQYATLRDKGWSERDAGAFVTAKDAVEATQYIYAPWAQPKFMRGKLRTVFVFKTFIQNTLFMLWNYPTAAVRSMLIMGFLGGLMGIPGSDDLRGILKGLAWHLFGKDFDLEEEGRKFALDVLNERIPPDILMHGMARRGFGLPAVMDMMGVPYPEFDRSKAISLGQVSPVDFGTLFGPHKDTSQAIADSAQRASGAAFGIGFNIYKAMTDSTLDWKDFKRWERALPRTMASASRAYRALNEGTERTRSGATVANFDTSDPRQMAEILGMAMGYQPMRLSAQWDRIIAEREAVTYWDLRREMILRQLYAARQQGDQDAYSTVLGAMRKFNEESPPGKQITADTISKSFQTRAQQKNAAESGTPRSTQNIPLVRDVQRLYPEAKVDVRRVK